MRPSSPGLAGAFAEGAAAAGADVTMIGLASTDQLYFASGFLGQAGAMFTASHNPAAYNGIKLCRSYARPVGLDTGLAEIRDLVEGGAGPRAAQPGTIVEQDVLEAYAAHLVGLAPVTGRRLKVVADAGNAMAGLTAPAVLGRRRRRRRAGAALLRARRHLPEPRREPARRVHAGRPPGAGGGRGRRRRPGLRRRRRPVLPGRRDRRRGLAVGRHGAHRHPRAGEGAGRDDHPQPDHEPLGARDRPRARRHPGADEGRPLGHQGADGRDQRDLRRRALRALLLPRLLARRLRHARRPARPGGPRRDRTGRCRR